jgi:uroporphyrinogen-III synthase
MTSDGRQELEGFTVGITADRRSEDQAVMFRRLGADVVLGPTMATVFGSDDTSLRAATDALIAQPPDYLLANTGIGIRTWMARAQEWGVTEELNSALGQSRILARGPKAAAALSSAGLPVWWRAPGETLAEVIDQVVDTGVDGRRVAFQLHGDDVAPSVEHLHRHGATVVPVAPYRWTLPDKTVAALELIKRCCEGRIDAVTFTAGPQVHNLMELADAEGLSAALLGALNDRVVVGCIGPVCAAAASEEGIAGTVVPEHWRLGSLVKAVAAELQTRGPARASARPATHS